MLAFFELSYATLPPIRPIIAPNPIFQVVEHVWNKSVCNNVGWSINDKPIAAKNETIVNVKTTVKIVLNIKEPDLIGGGVFVLAIVLPYVVCPQGIQKSNVDYMSIKYRRK